MVSNNLSVCLLPNLTPIISGLAKQNGLKFLIFHLTRTKNHLKKVYNFVCRAVFVTSFLIKTSLFMTFWQEIITPTLPICRGYEICQTNFTSTWFKLFRLVIFFLSGNKIHIFAFFLVSENKFLINSLWH